MAPKVITEKSLFDRLGGIKAIRATVEHFYKLVLADPELRPFFAHVDMRRLKGRQVDFFTQALGGPARYRGRDMKAAHTGLGIQSRHFDAVAGHLVETLRVLGVPENTINEVVQAVAPLKPVIVTNGRNKNGKNGRGEVMASRQKGSRGGVVSGGQGIQIEANEEFLSTMDGLQANVFVADADFNITFANQKAIETLRAVESELQRVFNIRVDQIVGQSIHRFHQDPARVERILRNPASLPHEAEFAFGNVTLRTSINAIFDADHEIAGYIVNWDNVSKRIELEREQARIQSMMENAPTATMMADLDLKINYTNPATDELLKKLEAYLPVRPDQVLGSSIDIFHKDPAYQKRILSNDKNLPVRAKIQIGPEKADLLVSAIYDQNGKYLGPMVTWDLITEREKLEVEQARVQSMMQNAPTAAMMADKDLKIIYANPATDELLKKLEAYLPVRPDQVVGSSIDLFHKDPTYQRKILSNEKNLPVRAKIQIGPEKADLLVSAIYDQKGNYLGPMVTWDLITEREKLEVEQARVTSMMENSPTATMMADKDLKIIYLNPASQKLLKEIEAYLPVPVDQVLGSHIDVFHKNPTHQRKILSNDKNLPVRAKIQIGPETADLQVSATYDQKGNYLGPMVVWDIITEKLKMETEQARISAMVENSPTATMMADKDLKIIYANPSSMRILKRLEAYLPVRVDQVVGSGIDIFHKDPAYQRKILSNDKNLPVRANIKIGPETADLQVSAIYDQNGEYVGPMVAWEVVTDKVKEVFQVFDAVRKTADVLANSSQELTASNTQMSAASQQGTAQANSVSAGAEEVSKNVQNVATMVEEMNSSMKEISKNAEEATRQANTGVKMAGDTKVTVGKLGDSSNEIGNVIKVITSIAQQTNLLALNATIEAARAGEAGKGFAVVANEVKELAKETAKATEDIGSKIETIQADAKGAVDAINAISEMINKINEIQSSIASAIEEQTVTTNEIARNLGDASKGTSDIAKNIAGVASGTKQTTDSIKETQKSADELAKLANDLQSLVKDLKKE